MASATRGAPSAAPASAPESSAASLSRPSAVRCVMPFLLSSVRAAFAAAPGCASDLDGHLVGAGGGAGRAHLVGDEGGAALGERVGVGGGRDGDDHHAV